MYEPVGYKTYADTDAFANGIEAQIPVEGSIARGWAPYDYPDTNEGYESAKTNLISPLELTEENAANCTINCIKFFSICRIFFR
jgi:hypothetical protein